MERIKQPELQKELFFSIFSLTLVSLVDLLIQFLFPNLETRITIIITGILLTLAIIFLWKKLFKIIRRKPSTLLIIASTAVLLFIIGNFIFVTFKERRTVYFLVDSSEQMQNIFADVKPRIQLEASTPERVDIGLSVFGGNIGGRSGCDDVSELLAPTPYENGYPKLIQELELLQSITPSGFAPLQNAVLYSIKKLENRRGIHQIFVVTSGIDPRCNTLSRIEIDQFASEKNVQFELTILSVGDVSLQEQSYLSYFSKGQYVYLKNPEELNKYLENVVNVPPTQYWYGYITRH